jgi:hypothetical protein
MQILAEYYSRIILDRTSITLKLPELEYLLLNLTTLTNQLARYKLFEGEVSIYVQSAAGATAFVPPSESVCQYVQYDILFEEINSDLCLCARAIMLCKTYVREIIPMTVCMCVLRHVLIFEETFCIYEPLILFM